DRVELGLPLGEMDGERFQHARALMERHAPERRPADGTRVLGHRLEVEPRARRLGHVLARDGVEQLGEVARALDPFAERVVLQTSHAVLSKILDRMNRTNRMNDNNDYYLL